MRVKFTPNNLKELQRVRKTPHKKDSAADLIFAGRLTEDNIEKSFSQASLDNEINKLNENVKKVADNKN